jgi:glycosyltransferase involved in cell wall biosynthesis
MIIKALEGCGHDIVDCSDSAGTYLARFLHSMLKFLKTRKTGISLVMVGCLGHYFVPLARSLTHQPIIFDPFVSLYDTMCLDRKKYQPGSLPGQVLFLLDRLALRQADRILLDTDAHIDYFVQTFGLPREKFHRVLVGADESIFYPREKPPGDGIFRVFYYSSFLPLHGTKFVIEAANRLHDQRDIEFTVVGRGLEKDKTLTLARSLGVDNVRFIDWLPFEELPLEIARADVCLGGHFSNSDKSRRVIAGKTYQFLAMRKAVIVGDCGANRELFRDRHHVLMTRMGDADALAEAIMVLRKDRDLRDQIALRGYELYCERCTTAAIGKELENVMYEIEGASAHEK